MDLKWATDSRPDILDTPRVYNNIGFYFCLLNYNSFSNLFRPVPLVGLYYDHDDDDDDDGYFLIHEYV